MSLKYFDSLGFLILSLSKLFKFKGRNNAVIGIKVWNLLMPLSRLIDKLFFHQFGKSLICVIQKMLNELFEKKNNSFTFFLFLLSLNYLIPLLIFGKITLFYHDTLDSEIVYNYVIGKYYSGDAKLLIYLLMEKLI